MVMGVTHVHWQKNRPLSVQSTWNLHFFHCCNWDVDKLENIDEPLFQVFFAKFALFFHGLNNGVGSAAMSNTGKDNFDFNILMCQ